MPAREPQTYPVDQRLLTTRQVAGLLAVSATTVRRLARRGALPAVRIGRSVRYRVGDVDSLTQRPSTDEDGV